MPQIKIISSSGPASIAYTIATPTSENAQTIDPTLPIVLFLHPMYLGQATFHCTHPNFLPENTSDDISSPVRQCKIETVQPHRL